MTAGEIALIVLAALWALLVVAFVFVSTSLFRVLLRGDPSPNARRERERDGRRS